MTYIESVVACDACGFANKQVYFICAAQGAPFQILKHLVDVSHLSTDISLQSLGAHCMVWCSNTISLENWKPHRAMGNPLKENHKTNLELSRLQQTQDNS